MKFCRYYNYQSLTFISIIHSTLDSTNLKFKTRGIGRSSLDNDRVHQSDRTFMFAKLVTCQ